MHMGFYSVSLLCTRTSTHKCKRVRVHTHTHTHTHKTTFIRSIHEMQHYNINFLLSVKWAISVPLHKQLLKTLLKIIYYLSFLHK